MSGDERRYVPPDHMTTAEFAAPKRGSGDAVRASETAPDVLGTAPPTEPAGSVASTTAPDIPNGSDGLEASEAGLDEPGAAPPSGSGETNPDESAARHGAERASDDEVSGEPPADARAVPMEPPASVRSDPVETPAGVGAVPAEPPPADVRAVPAVPRPDVRVAPVASDPVAPIPAPAEDTRPVSTEPARGGTFGGLLFALGTGVVVIAIAVGAMFVLRGGGEQEPAPATSEETRAGGADPVPTTGAPTAVAPTGAPTVQPGAPGASSAPAVAPTGVPSPGPTLQGDGVTYQVVQRDPGYYEGTLVVTNRTGRPLTAWRLEFRVPGANIRNVWGGRLVRGGERVVITNEAGAAAVPPGGVWKVQFGASGAPAMPTGCVVNGRGCGLLAGG